MGINIDVFREVELIIREQKEKEDKAGDKKISSELPMAARELSNTLRELESDLNKLGSRMHESGLDTEFRELKGEIREKLSSFLM